ncbi:hypothetical protein DB31_3231 [Hyalangium minutum]|uniref:Uncharacterized protein n=1 Tax=Hyalangium minutum TaxID=394096 RepID=A0A085WTT8_9BACT|nr:hypothetical protein DB31_3231 [Hyalangium minutum]
MTHAPLGLREITNLETFDEGHRRSLGAKENGARLLTPCAEEGHSATHPEQRSRGAPPLPRPSRQPPRPNLVSGVP